MAGKRARGKAKISSSLRGDRGKQKISRESGTEGRSDIGVGRSINGAV
jgi:hypothetical protein